MSAEKVLTLKLSFCCFFNCSFIVYVIIGSGSIDFSDFMTLMCNRMTAPDNIESLNQSFSLFDKNGTGEVTVDNLKEIASEIGLSSEIKQGEMEEMIQFARDNCQLNLNNQSSNSNNSTNNQTVNKEQFMKVMKKAGLY